MDNVISSLKHFRIVRIVCLTILTVLIFNLTSADSSLDVNTNAENLELNIETDINEQPLGGKEYFPFYSIVVYDEENQYYGENFCDTEFSYSGETEFSNKIGIAELEAPEGVNLDVTVSAALKDGGSCNTDETEQILLFEREMPALDDEKGVNQDELPINVLGQECNSYSDLEVGVQSVWTGENLYQYKCGLERRDAYGSYFWRYRHFFMNASHKSMQGSVNNLTNYLDDNEPVIRSLNVPESVELWVNKTENNEYELLANNNNEKIYKQDKKLVISSCSTKDGNLLKGENFYRIKNIGDNDNIEGNNITCISPERKQELLTGAENFVENITIMADRNKGEIVSKDVNKEPKLPPAVEIIKCKDKIGFCLPGGTVLEEIQNQPGIPVELQIQCELRRDEGETGEAKIKREELGGSSQGQAQGLPGYQYTITGCP